jgi:Ni/Fe-hydrogenase subunit HybB-like protein
MAHIAFERLDQKSTVLWGLIALNALLIALGLGAAHYMESHGHIVSGMNNQVVWGLPHVFAVMLIVTASGALNFASLSSVFGKTEFKPYVRLSAILSIALLVGGLAVLVLDLGRPERLVVAMTTYNFKSIFAWNIYLYTGFLAIVAAYLFVMTDRTASRVAGLVGAVGTLAFVWRLVLTTGTGSIFGFLVAREAYDSALLAPLFISASLLYGVAATAIVLEVLSRSTQRELLPPAMSHRFAGLLMLFALSTLYFTAAFHLTKLYASKHQGFEAFLLRDGGIYTLLFWIGEVGIGLLLPLVMLAATRSRGALLTAAALVLAGGFAHIYVTIIGGQAYPLAIFPGMSVSSSFGDGAVASYTPSLPEILLGVSGVAIAMLLTALSVKLLPFLPKSIKA